ncbi:MAG TPA: nucleotidyltransferase [Chitinophagaceae bacterium]
MDILNESLLEFWKSLNKYKVAFLMVGGFAVRFNGYNRATEDLDLWLKDSVENRQKFRKAYAETGYGDFASFETIQFVPGWTQFYVGDGIVLDIMTSMKGLENKSFDECYREARIADLDGIRVPFLHINDLLLNKKAVGRPKDQLDVLELEKIKKYLDEKEKGKND